MVVSSKMFIISATLVIVLLISSAHAGPLSSKLLEQKEQGKEELGPNEGHNIQRRHLREMGREVLHDLKITQYGHPGPNSPSFNSEHYGPYSHQYHNQFYGQHYPHHNPHHEHNHFSHGHYPHNYHPHHHHNHGHHDCDHSDSDGSSSEETTNHNTKPKPLRPGKDKELPSTSPPSPQPTEPNVPTTDVSYDIDVRLGGSR